MKPPWWFCCGWWSPYCVLDTVIHRLHIDWDWVCDRHDAALERHLTSDETLTRPVVDVNGLFRPPFEDWNTPEDSAYDMEKP